MGSKHHLKQIDLIAYREGFPMRTHVKLTGFIITLLCSGCGGGGGGGSTGPITTPTPPVATPVVTSTADLVASKEFNFRSDRTLTLSFGAFPSAEGKFVLYGSYAHFDAETNTYYPDYSTRLGSYIATPDLDYDIVVPGSQTSIMIEWLPMDGLSNETYRLLTLNGDSAYRVEF